MYKDGYVNISNIDISTTVIEQMKEKYKEEIPDLKCNVYCMQWIVEVMDVKSLKYPNNSFDAVIDKGTLDSVLVLLLPELK